MNNDLSEQKTNVAVYEQESVDIANALAQARQKTSLLESKIELLAIYKVRQDFFTIEKSDAEGNPYKVHAVSISNSELKRLLNTNSGSMYSQLEYAATELMNKKIIYRNPGEQEFSFDNLFESVTYRKGIFNIEFSPKTEHLFLELNDKFTRLPLAICFSFSKNGGFQLYKLLKSLCWTLGNSIDANENQENQKSKVIEFNLAELRMQLGYINLEQTPLKKEASRAHPDFDKMKKMERNPKYARWVDFKDKVLLPGIAEINEISDLYISNMEPISGAHNKTSGVRFVVQNNVNYYHRNNSETINVEEDNNIAINHTGDNNVIDEDDFVDSLRDMMQLNISTKEYKAIASAGRYDYRAIEKVFEEYKNAKNIKNTVGWIIDALTNPHSSPLEKSGSEVNSGKTKFSNFNERSYDYEEFAKIILNQ